MIQQAMKPHNKTAIRSFIALEPDASISSSLQAAVKRYQQETWASQVRWTEFENLHMTLKFLHNAPQTQVDQLIETLQKHLTNQLAPGFSLQLNATHTGLFPSKQQPFAVVAHVENNPQLNTLVKILEDSATNCKFKPENRTFKGHITLGRCRELFSSTQKVTPLAINKAWQVQQLYLFKSELSNHGPVYTKLKEFKLGPVTSS